MAVKGVNPGRVGSHNPQIVGWGSWGQVAGEVVEGVVDGSGNYIVLYRILD